MDRREREREEGGELFSERSKSLELQVIEGRPASEETAAARRGL